MGVVCNIKFCCWVNRMRPAWDSQLLPVTVVMFFDAISHLFFCLGRFWLTSSKLDDTRTIRTSSQPSSDQR